MNFPFLKSLPHAPPSKTRYTKGYHGAGFASGFKDTDMLAQVLATLDEPSLTKLINDHEGGKLAGHIEKHA